MGSRSVLTVAYGLVWFATALSVGRRFWKRRDQALTLAALGSGALAVALLGVGLAWQGVEAGTWPMHTTYERLNVGLLGALLMSMGLISVWRDELVWLISLLGPSLVAAVGLWTAGVIESASFVYIGGWGATYVGLSALGGGALLVAGAAAVIGAWSPSSTDSNRPKALARRALSWGLLTLSAGLASGTWWFQRISGRYWGNTRWLGLVVVGLLAGAAWQVRGEWLGRGWRSAVVGVLFAVCGGFVVLGVGGGVG